MFKNKKIARVGISLVALLVALAMTITATYAWFTLSAAPKISNFKLEVTTAVESLFISVDQDPDNWKAKATGNYVNTVTTDMLEDNVLDFYEWDGTNVLGAVTTTDGINFKNVEGVKISANTQPDDEMGTYLGFWVNFCSTSKVGVTLTGTADSTSKSHVSTPNDFTGLKTRVYAWEALTATKYGATAALNDRIFASSAYASRFSFADIQDQNYIDYLQYLADISTYNTFIAAWNEWLAEQNETDNSKTNSEVYSGLTTAYDNTDTSDLDDFIDAFEIAKTVTFMSKTTDLIAVSDYEAADAPALVNYTAKVWNPTETNSVIDNRKNASIGNNESYCVFKNIGTDATNNFAHDYYVRVMGGNPNVGTASSAMMANSVTLNTTSIVELQQLTNIANGEPTDGFYYGRMWVSIWLEGWDANCTDMVLDDAFTSSLHFGVAA